MDGDGLPDAALAAMTASPGRRSRAGLVFVIFGDGELSGSVDTAAGDATVLRVEGSADNENAGAEIWMDDVDGDGLGDLLIARQNHTHLPGEADEILAAGALSIVFGSPELRVLAERGEALLLGSTPPSLRVLTLVGERRFDRLSLWMRTGDVTGDGIADIIVAADQDDTRAADAGAVYLIAGGADLARTETITLSSAEGSFLAGYIAKILPPAEPAPVNYHFGATCQIADLDGNGRGEVLAAAALNRSGASLGVFGPGTAEASGGSANGTLYVIWDDAFPDTPWPSPFEIGIDPSRGDTIVRGDPQNESFGEEIVGGADWDDDGLPDLFVGDLVADFSGRANSGSSHVIYDAARLRGMNGTLSELLETVPALRVTHVYGAAPDHISGDTAAFGDFNGDGVDDLITCSPHGNPLGRTEAGAIHVLFGQSGGWPESIELFNLSAYPELPLLEVYGARATRGSDTGDTLCYSAAAADLDGDGKTDLLVNEMEGNGQASSALDAGNLLLLPSRVLAGEVGLTESEGETGP